MSTEPLQPRAGVARRATLRDVAALAGVSFKTVSRVINGERGVSTELAGKVRDAAARLDYQPNQTASSLRRHDGRSQGMGLLVDDIANPFFASIHRGVEGVALAHHYTVLTGSGLEDPERERLLVAAFARRRVDGLLVTPSGRLADHLAAERRTGTKLVLLDRLPEVVDVDVVLADHLEGAQGGTAHLVAHGHRRIAFLGDLSSIQTAVARHDGYAAALAAAGLAYDPLLVRRDLHSAEQGMAAALDLLQGPEPPMAVFAAQNLVTIGTLRALRRLGLSHRVALVGFDDVPLGDLLEPAVTVVAQDGETMGRIAAERLLARIGGMTVPPEVIVVPTHLVARGSGELAPAT